MMPLKQGRNDSCACGSGKKYKQCCMLLPKKTNNTPTLNVASSEISEALKTASDYISAGKYQDSVRICQAILQMRPHHQEALNMLGVLAYYAGNNELALNLLSKALNINNQYTDAHNNIAEVYRASGKFRKAISHLQEAIRLKSNYVDALINYGNVLQDIHEYDLALAQYNKVLKNNPSHKGALSNKANLLQQLNRHSEAIVVYEKLITIDEAEQYLTEFEEKWEDAYPPIAVSWRNHWARITPFFDYPPEIRKVIYTTNAIESVNMSLCKVTKSRGSFPNDEAVMKLFYLALQNISQKWTMPLRDWKPALNRFTIQFEERMPQQ